jgi:hypothetical protein
LDGTSAGFFAAFVALASWCLAGVVQKAWRVMWRLE